MSDLLDLLGGEWSGEPNWTPIYLPSGGGTLSTMDEHKAYLAAARCRDCGGKVNHDRGGAGREGAWFLCHECGAIEDLPRWGRTHDFETGHSLDVLIERQRARRRRFATR
ncbi:hypothetical protein [Microbacterium sp. GCS4]|uniref:hypothetical protein n=1 Tax=Microbacterium sp. GCS4 TaxID=1692239 RepID=UPI000680D793|nr:hypothetical protein [Microbacterium sp. GCS4]KNY06873.1 hypothetical protein AKH00_00590 [Microbacterium sp. GCS4]